MSATNPVPTLLAGLRSEQATSPALVWHGNGGERIELSGRVLDNWVAKTSNFLVDELDAEPGMRLRLAMPVHWKTLVWALAGWQTGCTVVLGSDGPAPAATVVSSEDEVAAAAGTVVAVAPGALDLHWNGMLPAGAVDYAAEVRSYADTFVGDDSPGDDVPALETGALATTAPTLSGTVTYGRLPGAAAGAGPRTLLAAGVRDLPLVLEAGLLTWAAGGCLVLTAPGVDVTQSLLNGERVTERLDA